MRHPLFAAAALAVAAAVPRPAAAGGVAELEINAAFRLPLPAAPPLVVVQPGVQVVRDHDYEVFVHGGAYWVRRGDRWYRSHGPQASFVLVETRLVPEPLRKLPPGHYRHYRPPPPPHKLDKKEEKRLRKEEEKARKEHEKEQGHDHDHGKGH